MESEFSHPTKLSLSKLDELLNKLKAFYPTLTPSSYPDEDSKLEILSNIYSSLPTDSQTSFKNSLETPLPLEYQIKQQYLILSTLPAPKIQFKDDYRVEAAYKSGGLALVDQEVVTKIRSVGKEIIKLIGKKLLSGSFNLTQISFPIRCMQASTALQNSLNAFQMIPSYMTRAVSTTDFLERLKLVISATLSSFVYTSTFEKPLNPILGETQHGVLEDGTEMWSEQTCHHPPVSSFYIQGNAYKVFGYFNYTAKAGLNSVTVTNLGKRTFEFYDGYWIAITCPEELFSGTFYGTMRHESLGVMNVIDSQGVTCEISIGKIRGKPSDYLEGEVKNAEGGLLASLQGTYLGWLEFDGIRYWDVRCSKPFRIEYTKRLESDSENRKDMTRLRSGKIAEAQVAKEELENLQRHDRKLRAKYSSQ